MERIPHCCGSHSRPVAGESRGFETENLAELREMSEIFLFESTFSDHEGTYHHMPNHMAKGHTDYCRWQPSIYSLMRYHEGHNHISDVQKSSIVTSPCDSNRTRFDTPSCGRVFGRNAMGSYFRDVNVPSSFQLRVRLGQASHSRGSVQTTDSERKSIKLSALWAAPGGRGPI